MPTDHPLAILADRAAGDPFFLGFAIARWQAAERLDDLAACRRLGVADLTSHRLCRMPADRAEVGRIVERFGGDYATLCLVAGVSS